MPNQTEAVLRRHLQAASEGVDAVMEDYVDESVLITHDATHRGRVEIRQDGAFASMPVTAGPPSATASAD